MSSATFQRSFGLGYLDEQQRFKHKEMSSVVKSQPRISDFSQSTINIIQPALNIAPTLTPLQKSLVNNDVLRQRVALSVNKLPVDTPHTTATLDQSQHFAGQFDEVKELTRVGRIRAHKLLPVIVALVAFMSGAGVLTYSIYQNHKAVAQVAAVTSKAESSGSQDETPPDETPVSSGAIKSYAVAPDLPRLITIKKINVTARVLSMGILSSGALATPRNTNDTGWYSGSSKPGDGGAALIVGHVSGAVNAGIFYNIKNLNAGDTIEVERGDGQKFTYKVVKKTQVPAGEVNMSELLVPVTSGKAGLNLMTCGGKYVAADETFTDRVLVYAEQV